MLNEHYARYYGGKLLIRFDDTNPSKESEEYESSIIEDLGKLGVVGDMVSHTSDHFDLLAEFARQMIREGNAYMDNTPMEEMRKERGERVEGKHRNMDPATALAHFERMWTGEDTSYCMRARIDMKSFNGCLRDPVMFRNNLDPHHQTGTKCVGCHSLSRSPRPHPPPFGCRTCVPCNAPTRGLVSAVARPCPRPRPLPPTPPHPTPPHPAPPLVPCGGQVQGVPHVRLCLPHRGQRGGCDPRVAHPGVR
jgi:hypothetical protein